MSLRLTTDFWVSAIVRRVFGDGSFAAIEKRGATEAGAVYIRCRTRTGETLLYGPAPQSGYEEARPGERLFALVLKSDDPEKISERLAKEKRFDPDLWIVELEVEEAVVGTYLELI